MSVLHRIQKTLLKSYGHIFVHYEHEGEIEIAKVSKDGFDITVIIDARENTLVFGEWHYHFEQSEPEENELIQVLAFGLSRLGRLAVTQRGARLSRCAFEMLDTNGTWITYAEMRVVNMSLFARRITKYYQNDFIPIEDFRTSEWRR